MIDTRARLSLIGRICLGFIIALQLAVIAFYGVKKDSYFIDEVYSYGLSNSYYAPFLSSYGDTWDSWLGPGHFMRYITVQSDERFAYGSVYQNQVEDVHPPLYYWMLHTVSSFFPEVFSKWFGIALNMLFFVIGSVFLYLLSQRIIGDPLFALLPQLLWGAVAAVNTVMYIRMYMLLTLIATILFYLHVLMAQEGQTAERLIFVSLIILAGLLTHYYFAVLCLTVGPAYLVFRFVRKDFKGAGSYLVTAVGALGVFLIVYPAIWDHVLGQNFIGETTRQNIASFRDLPARTRAYSGLTSREIFGSLNKIAFIVLAVLMVAGIGSIILNKARRNRQTGDPVRFNAERVSRRLCWLAAIALPTVIALLIVANISSMVGIRYVYFLLPMVAVSLVAFAALVLKLYLRSHRYVFLVLLSLVILNGAVAHGSGDYRYVYADRTESRGRLHSMHSDKYNIVFTDYHDVVPTAELFELMEYRAVYMTSADSVSVINSILADKDVSEGLVVTIDTNEFWSSGYSATAILDQLLDTGLFSTYERVYEYGLVDTYVLR